LIAAFTLVDREALAEEDRSQAACEADIPAEDIIPVTGEEDSRLRLAQVIPYKVTLAAHRLRVIPAQQIRAMGLAQECRPGARRAIVINKSNP
jgi:hypothetical protein